MAFFKLVLPLALLSAIFVCNAKVIDGAIGNALSIGDADYTGEGGEGPASKFSVMASNLCLSEHNAARSQNGKSPLAYDTKLEQAAKGHNNVMTSQNCFSHQCSNEKGLGDRVTATGYRWSGVAENIAAGQTSCSSVMNSWMNSSGHKANILGNYRHVGCARNDCSTCTYKVYWTCVFGNPM